MPTQPLTQSRRDSIERLSVRAPRGEYPFPYSPEATAKEPPLVVIRDRTTIASRLDAWRTICKASV